MKKLVLVNAGLAAAVSAALDCSSYRVIEREDFCEDELRLTGASIDACVFDADLTTVDPIRKIEMLRRLMPKCPLILYASDSRRSWEEEAYLLGANNILSKPVRGRLLNSLLDRLCTARTPTVERQGPQPQQDKRVPEGPMTGRMQQLLHNSSSILCHSLCVDLLLEEFLLVLRETLCINRAAIFLRASPVQIEATGDTQQLTSAFARGISPLLMEHGELYMDSGIGGYIFRSGRVLRRNSTVVESAPQMAREFDLLGVRVAMPVLNQGSLIGVVMLDERITGEPITNDELALIFSLLEQLGPAIQNSWWHEQVSAQHEMMREILRNIKVGCILVGQDLNVLHANARARTLFPSANRPPKAFKFSDMPQVISGKVF